MINLLSIQDQKVIKNAYQRELLAWYSLLLFAFLIVLLVLAGCLYFLITFRANAEQSILSSLQIGDKTNPEAGQVTVENINKAVLSMARSAQVPRMADLINVLLSQKPAGIKITNFNLTTTDAGGVAVKLKGIAANRQVLLDFSTLLQGLSGFRKVVSPYSNLVKKTNAEFDVSLEAFSLKSGNNK